MKSALVIYAREITPRLQYAIRELLQPRVREGIQLLHDEAAYRAAAGIKIHYGAHRICPDEWLIPPHGLLSERGIRTPALEYLEYAGVPVFFGCPQVPAADLPFDILAYAFYYASRYEEYLPFAPDRHGRFSAASGISTALGCLERPVVDIALRHFLTALYARQGWKYQTAPAYRFEPTYDIDMVWSYLHKGALRTLGGMANDLLHGRFQRVMQRLLTHLRLRPDPAFTFDLIDSMREQYGNRDITFFLLGDPTAFDKNQSHGHPALRRFIHSLYSDRLTGIHPSYYAGQHRTQEEKIRLETILQRPVTRSRQHYLRLRFPDTCRHLLAAGITDDYSMGFADAVGFRAGMCLPFRWYDLAAEAVTGLTLHPFCLMDVTLNRYMGLSPREAMEKADQLLAEVRAVNGVFGILWHNTSLDDTEKSWKGWREVYRHIVRAGMAKALDT